MLYIEFCVNLWYCYKKFWRLKLGYNGSVYQHNLHPRQKIKSPVNLATGRSEYASCAHRHCVLVCLPGFEPGAFPLGGERSILLSYKHIFNKKYYTTIGDKLQGIFRHCRGDYLYSALLILHLINEFCHSVKYDVPLIMLVNVFGTFYAHCITQILVG